MREQKDGQPRELDHKRPAVFLFACGESRDSERPKGAKLSAWLNAKHSHAAKAATPPLAHGCFTEVY